MQASTTASSWRERQARAAFRGITFSTDSYEAKGGRRLVVHEVPGAEEPLVQDMGGKAWDGKLSAYFLGDNYDQARDALLTKLAIPGADWLTHPWLGRLWVRVKDWSVQESTVKGGLATVSIDFVPGGINPLQGEADVTDTAQGQCEALADTAEDGFTLADLNAASLTTLVAAIDAKLEPLRSLVSMAAMPLAWINQAQRLIAGVKGEISTLLDMPQRYAQAIRSLAGQLGNVDALVGSRSGSAGTRLRVVESLDTVRGGAPAARARIFSGLARTVMLDLGPNGASTRAIASASDMQQDPAQANATTSPLLQLDQCLAAEAVMRNTVIVSTLATSALRPYANDAERDEAVQLLTSAFDWLLPALPDALFEQAATTRASVLAALQAQSVARSVARDVVHPMPATVLAYQVGVSESALIERNGIRHPLFVTGRVYG